MTTPLDQDTVGDLIRIGALRTPDRAVVEDIDTGERRTYAEMDQGSTLLANSLLALGLKPGDRVAAWMRTDVHYVELYLALAKARLVMVPINELHTADEAAFQLGDAGPMAMVFSAGMEERLESLGLVGEMPLIAAPGAEPVGGATAMDDLLAQGSLSEPPGARPEDLFMICYTSGTTGFPKGAMISHRAACEAARTNALAYRLPLYSVGLYRLSMSFAASVPAFIFSHLHVGGTLLLLHAPDPDRVVDMVRQHRATYTSVPAPVYRAQTEAFRRRPEDWTSLVTVLSASSKIPAEQLHAMADVVGSRWMVGWGMTENSGALATATTALDASGAGEAGGDVFESAGRATPGSAVRVVGEDGQELPRDGRTIGELVIRSPSLASGYWKNPEASAGVLVDGWYRTGDLGTIDSAGYVYVSDRRADLIVSGGMNVYPSEVERILLTCPGVRECAVVGRVHPRWGQTVVAVVVAELGFRLSAEMLVQHCRAHLAGYKKPTEIVFLDSLPRTVSQKVRRNLIREMIEAPSGGSP